MSFNWLATNNAHLITVPAARTVTVEAAPGADIVIRMPVPGAPNTPNMFPWTTTLAALVRHFNIASGGNLTLGGGPAAGTLTLDGNADLNTSNRGGISVAAGGTLNLAPGGNIENNRAATGGGVIVTVPLLSPARLI